MVVGGDGVVVGLAVGDGGVDVFVDEAGVVAEIVLHAAADVLHRMEAGPGVDQVELRQSARRHRSSRWRRNGEPFASVMVKTSLKV